MKKDFTFQYDCFLLNFSAHFILFFCQGFLSQESGEVGGEEGGASHYCSPPLPPAQEHLDTCLFLCMWDGYYIFLITPLVITRPLPDEIYNLIELSFDRFMMEC